MVFLTLMGNKFIGEFQPEYKGKMEFYLSPLNDKIKLPSSYF
jgi:hypothetical protein